MNSFIKKLKIKNPQYALVIGLSATILLLAAAYILIIQNSKPASVAQTHITREQAVPKAQEYLLKDLKSIDPTLRLIMDFLYRKFNINNQFSGQINTINTAAQDPLVQYELKAATRFAYKDSLVDDLGPNPTLVARGANCDHIPLPSNISSLLQQEIDKGSYDLTHVFLSMQLMKELDCKVNDEESLRSQTISAMISMADSDKTPPDLRYECIAFLLYAGKLDIIDPAWIDQIYADQQPDGGWKLDKTDAKSDHHTTVLALWALLEYNQPNAPYEPIIHKASNETDNLVQ